MEAPLEKLLTYPSYVFLYENYAITLKIALIAHKLTANSFLCITITFIHVSFLPLPAVFSHAKNQVKILICPTI